MTQDLKLSSNIYSEHVTVDSATVVLVVTTTTQNNSIMNNAVLA